MPYMVRVGIGYDVHRLVEGRKCIIGGVHIPHPKGLEGHSDADVLLHAICDAILGALGTGDIGKFFPPDDPRWRNAPSRVFLQEAAQQVSFHKGRIINIDSTLIAEQPKILPHVEAMQSHIGEALRMDMHRINVKATTNELMGFVGRGEGIAAMAVASVELPD